MNIVLSSLLILATTIAIYADPQYGYGFGYPQQYPAMPYDAGYPDQSSYFRAGAPQASFDSQSPENRLFFGTVTLTLATTTSYFTVTSSTTCTTSTAAISICSPSGRRRRGLSSNGKNGRSLMFDGKDSHFDNIFVGEPQPAPAAVEPEPERETRSVASPVPFVIQPGFNAPTNVRGARFAVAFGTATTTSTTTSTYTYVLTALCKSTTSYSSCASSGK